MTCGATPNFLLNQTGATVSATVTDATSGPTAATASAAAATSSIGTFSVSLTGTDVAGNSTQQSCPYTVSYKLNLVYDNSVAYPAGDKIPIKLQLLDASGTNVSSTAITVTAVSIVNSAGNVVRTLNVAFNYVPPSGPIPGQYTFQLDTTGLTTGAYKLLFNAGKDPRNPYQAPFTIQFGL